MFQTTRAQALHRKCSAVSALLSKFTCQKYNTYGAGYVRQTSKCISLEMVYEVPSV